MYYHASQTTGDDTMVRLCGHHATAVGYGGDHYAGSAEPDALCDESPLLKRTLRRFDRHHRRGVLRTSPVIVE